MALNFELKLINVRTTKYDEYQSATLQSLRYTFTVIIIHEELKMEFQTGKRKYHSLV